MQIDKSKIKNILIIQTAFFGDAIITSSLISKLNSVMAHTKIDVIATPDTFSIFNNNPYINNVYKFDKRSGKIKKYFSFFKILSFIKKEKYSASISVQSSFTTALFSKLASISIRIGFPKLKFVTHPVKKLKGKMHMKDVYVQLASYFTDDLSSVESSFYISDKIAKTADKYLGTGLVKIAVAPGSVWDTKRWPIEYFKELVSKLSSYSYEIYLIGGNAEKDLAKKICSLNSNYIIDLTGKITFNESSYIISKMDLIITNDSAPLHVANAVDIPVIAIFGPTVKRFGFYPYRKNDELLEVDLDCRPCSHHGGKNCPQNHFKCMKNITPNMVYDKVIKFLKKKEKI